MLDQIFCAIDGKFATSASETISFCPTDTRNGDTLVPIIGQMVEEALGKKCEGLILKDALSTYSPSKRSSKWLKLKGDYMDAFGDTLDLVPIAAWKGQGKGMMCMGHSCAHPITHCQESMKPFAKLVVDLATRS